MMKNLKRSAVALAAALKTNKTLQNIHLNNNMRDESIIAWAETLKINNSLQSVILSAHYGSDGKGIRAIAAMLEKNTSLQYLRVGRNLNDTDDCLKIYEECDTLILKYLERNRALAKGETQSTPTQQQNFNSSSATANKNNNAPVTEIKSPTSYYSTTPTTLATKASTPITSNSNNPNTSSDLTTKNMPISSSAYMTFKLVDVGPSLFSESTLDTESDFQNIPSPFERRTKSSESDTVPILQTQTSTTASIAKTPPIVGVPNASVSTIIPSQITSLTDYSLLTDPTLKQYIIFLRTLPKENLTALESLGKQGVNLSHMLPTLNQLKANQEELTQRLETVEIHSGLDAQTQAEIAYIQKNENLNRYYQALKMILGQTFLAAKVIGSGNVNATQGTSATIANGISTVAGALCPPAAPFLNFASAIVGVGDGIASYRAGQTLSGWIDLENIAQAAKAIALQLTIAQEGHLNRSLTSHAEKTLKSIQDKCTLIIERIKSGKTLTTEEARALLDANELLTYMKENSKPQKASLSNCVAILLSVIMGDDYVHDSSHIVITGQLTTVTTTTDTMTVMTSAISMPIQSHAITKEEWETMQRETAEAKRKAEEAQKQLEILRKQTAPSNSSSSHAHDNGDGTVSLWQQQQDTIINTTQGPVPLSMLIKSMQSQIANLEGGMGTTTQIVYQLQEKLNIDGVKNDEEIPDAQMRQDLFQGSSNSYQKTN